MTLYFSYLFCITGCGRQSGQLPLKVSTGGSIKLGKELREVSLRVHCGLAKRLNIYKQQWKRIVNCVTIPSTSFPAMDLKEFASPALVFTGTLEVLTLF